MFKFLYSSVRFLRWLRQLQYNFSFTSISKGPLASKCTLMRCLVAEFSEWLYQGITYGIWSRMHYFFCVSLTTRKCSIIVEWSRSSVLLEFGFRCVISWKSILSSAVNYLIILFFSSLTLSITNNFREPWWENN